MQEHFDEAILLEYQAHQLQLKKGKRSDVPSLRAFCKWAFFANEATLYANKKVLKRDDPHQVDHVLQANHINRQTLTTMRRTLHTAPPEFPTVFDQLDLRTNQLKP